MLALVTLTVAMAISVEMSALRERRQLFSSDDSDSLCLHGGTSVPSLYSGEHMFCMCAEGYTGRECEIDMSDSCFSGVGMRYRGPVSQTESGRECLEWDLLRSSRIFGADVRKLGLGKHNRCRNPDLSRKPWCYVRQGSSMVREYCTVPRCLTSLPSMETAKPVVGPTHSERRCGEIVRRNTKIVGGSLTTVKDHPWIAAIFRRSSSGRNAFLCGGSLITPCWVLTAAHCFPRGSKTRARKFTVMLGKNAINETDEAREQRFQVSEVIIHEDFDNSEGNFNNDIALMKIFGLNGACAEETESVRTVCLPVQEATPPTGVQCQIAGYGKEKEGLWYNSQFLQEGTVSLLSQETCSSKTYYGSMITDNMFCAGSPNWAIDACKGDSGGPLVCMAENRMVLYGVISWGEGCAREFRPGVYTRVTNYNPWIAQKTNQALNQFGSLSPLK